MENSTLGRKNTETEHIYTMQVGLSVLGHLGINLALLNKSDFG